MSGSLATANFCRSQTTEYRPAICAFENNLFTRFPSGLEILDPQRARRLINEIFVLCGRRPPALKLVTGFTDPHIGGYADIRRHRILIERGCTYRFLVLHEIAHILVPEDRYHGPAFTYVLQTLYRCYLGIPEEELRAELERHGLPIHASLPN